VRAVLDAGFTTTGVVVGADYGANAAFRAGLERLGLAYGVPIRGESTFAVAGVPGTLSATALAASAPDGAWETVTVGDQHRGPAHGPVLCAARAPHGGARRALAPVRTLGGGRAEVVSEVHLAVTTL